MVIFNVGQTSLPFLFSLLYSSVFCHLIVLITDYPIRITFCPILFLKLMFTISLKIVANRLFLTLYRLVIAK